MRRSHVRQNGPGGNIIGLLMHPKLRQVTIARTNQDSYVFVSDHAFHLIARGWYGGNERYALAEASGYPRAHVGSNANLPRDSGWGSVLYNSLCVGARVHDLGADLPEMRVSASGICSDSGSREPPASRWWASANRNGFSYTESVEVEDERETTENFEIDPSPRGSEYARKRYWNMVEAIQEYLEVHDIYGAEFDVPTISGTHTTSVGSREIDVDILPFNPESGATGISGMVLCTFKNAPKMNLDDLSWLTEDEVSDFNVDVLRLLDLREADEKAVALVRRVAEVMGALDVLEENLSTPRQNRRYNGLTPAQQAAARRVRLADWADLED